MQLYDCTIQEARKRLASREISAVELTTALLDRIEEIDSLLQCYLHVDRQGALEQAAQADSELARGEGGPLCGIPLSIKDVLCTTTMPTTCGSRMLEGFVPPYDATVIRRLRRAGAIFLGKVAMDEFAMGSTSENCAFCTPRNPWKPSHVTGGSSGGSAASVAAGTSLASIGSDTGGSIRQPASLCGVVGMKPTYGRVSRYGLVAFASSLDQVGPLTRSVADCALLMQVLAGYDERDSTSVDCPVPDYQAAMAGDLHGMRVGLPQQYFAAGLDEDVARTIERGIAMLKESGATVVDVDLPHTEYGVAAYYLIAPAEASSNLARYDGVRFGYRDRQADSLINMYAGSRSQGFGTEVKRRILIGTYALSAGYYDAYYKKASQVRTLIKQDFDQAFRHCDVLVSPVTPTPAWSIGAKADDPLALYLSDILTISANLAGIPGMSVPCGFSADGLPIGMQLQAASFQEATLLRVAGNLEKRAQIAQLRPSLDSGKNQ